MWNFVMKIAAVQSTAAAFLIHLFLIRFLICAFYSASFIFSHFLIQFDVPSMICMYTQYSKTLNRKWFYNDIVIKHTEYDSMAACW